MVYARDMSNVFNKCVERYCKTILIHKSNKTQTAQLSQLQWFCPYLGDKALDTIKKSDIIYLRDLLLTEKGVTSTVNRYMAVLSHLFTVACRDWDYITESPFKSIRKLKESRGRCRYLTAQELQLLLSECLKSPNKYLYCIIKLLVSTGARRNEICRLKWSDVNLDEGYIIINQSKNGDRRRLPINNELIELLEQLNKSKKDNIYVFQSPNRSQPICIQTAWKTVLKKCKLPDFRLHDLRHTCASYLAMNGANTLDIAQILGHRTLAMVKRYSHMCTSHTDNVLLKMNKEMM